MGSPTFDMGLLPTLALAQPRMATAQIRSKSGRESKEHSVIESRQHNTKNSDDGDDDNEPSPLSEPVPSHVPPVSTLRERNPHPLGAIGATPPAREATR